MPYTIEGIGYGFFIKDTATAQIVYFFGASTALKVERSNSGIFISSQNVDAVGGFLLLTKTVDNTEKNGIITPFDNSDPNATKNLFIFLTQNLQGALTVPNIWTETSEEIAPVNPNKSLVLGDFANQALIIQASDSNYLPAQIFINPTKTNTTGVIPKRQQIPGSTTFPDVYNIPTDTNTTLSGTLLLNCSDATTGQRQFASYGFFAADAQGNVFYKHIYEFAPTLATPNVDFYYLSPTEFALKITNNDGDAINVNSILTLNTNRV